MSNAMHVCHGTLCGDNHYDNISDRNELGYLVSLISRDLTSPLSLPKKGIENQPEFLSLNVFELIRQLLSLPQELNTQAFQDISASIHSFQELLSSVHCVLYWGLE